MQAKEKVMLDRHIAGQAIILSEVLQQQKP